MRVLTLLSRFRLAPALATLAAFTLAPPAALAQSRPRPPPVEVRVPRNPIPVAAEGDHILAYELHVTNFGAQPLALRELDIGRPDGGPDLAAYRDSSLAPMLHPVGASGSDPARIDVGRRLVVMVWLRLPLSARVPAALWHRLRFDVLDTATTQAGAIGSSSIDSIVVAVRPEAVPVIAPPVRGEWLAGNGPANGSDHRMAMIALDGRVSIAQRFAIDWVMVGPNGNTFHDTASRSENYWDFGQPVYAVADGEVVAVVDSIADNVPHTPLPPVTLANIAGNYVVLRIAPQRYALFAHLQRGSVRVRPQERVRRGAVLGLVGNSGQTTGPHLHFQIMDGPSPLASEGVPFVLDRFTFLGFGRDFEPDQHPTVAHTREMPVDDSVLLLP